jgi:hypothetical protein
MIINTLINFRTALAFAITLVVVGKTHADYAIITLKNSTNVTLNYSLKWGADGEWQPHNVCPGYSRYHYIALDDNGCAPTPYIKFDIGGGRANREYRLGFYATDCPCSDNGKPYVFRYYSCGLDLKSE